MPRTEYLLTLGVMTLTSIALAACASPGMQSETVYDLSQTPTSLEIRQIGSVDATEYTLMVPENRSDADSRDIALRFVVLPALDPSDEVPVLYLAGGPGGAATGTAQSRRWPLFDALRQNRDVILLDQRGTGRSERPPVCLSSVGWAPNEIGNRANFIAKQSAAFEECKEFWTEAGVDQHGYTSKESAADIAAISDVLDTRLALLGISYGTHLALATLNDHPASVERAVLVSVEGLDQTVKLPARTDAFVARLQSALDESSIAEGGAPYPDLSVALRRALNLIDSEPPMIEAFAGRGEPPVERTVGAFAVQRAISFALSDPDRAHQTASGILAMAADDPDYGFMTFFAGRLMPNQIELRVMPTMMDLASGLSPQRAKLVETQAQTALLGDSTNFPMPHLDDPAADYRLPDSFREDPLSDVPVLVVSGTLDGRTYPEAALEATRGLSARTVVTVENAGHNLFFDHPDVVPYIVDFLDGEPLTDTTLVAKLPELSER